MRRAEYGLLGWLGHYLCKLEFKPVVRMLRIADRVPSLGHADRVVRHHLHVLSVEQTVILLGVEIGNEGLARIEIVLDFVHLVALATLFHHGFAVPSA